MSTATMKSVVFKGPREIAVEDRPIPTIQSDTDVVVKVSLTALCGRYMRSPPPPSPHLPQPSPYSQPLPILPIIFL